MKILLNLFILFIAFNSEAQSLKMSDLLDKEKVKEKIEEELLKMDISASLDIASIDIIDGINLSSKYRYLVEPSYQDKYYTRIDKWDLNTNINPGTILKNYVETPFSFGVNRNSSFVFVRQYQDKAKALSALPYTPYKIPLTAKKALALNVGDFVSIPANLNLSIGIGASTSLAASPVVINGSINSFYVISGNFTIQVFKLDEKHVRVKLIASRSQNMGVNSRLKAEIEVMGFEIFSDRNENDETDDNEGGFGAKADRAISKQINKQAVRFVDRFIDREFFDFGMGFTPGAAYIADYIFDLTDSEAVDAYNQILHSAYKLKDIVAFDHFFSAKKLQEKLLTTTDLADTLASRYKDEKYENRKVMRVFKGFNNYKGFNRHIKFGVLIASYQKNTTYTENKITFIDKNEKSMEFFYPTYSSFFENKLGKWMFSLKDESNKTYFGLIPRKNNENVEHKSPDLGLTFERKDKTLTRNEQRLVGKFILNQLPLSFIRDLKLDQWRNGGKKTDSRIYFQVILKSMGFDYLRLYSKEELTSRLITYLKEKRLVDVILDNTNPDLGLDVDNDESATSPQRKKNLVTIDDIGSYFDKKQVGMVVAILHKALHDEKKLSEETLTKLIKLNEFPLFANVGMGFLISLIPEEKLIDYVYINLDFIAYEIEPLKSEFGTLNYRALYKEIGTIQSRLSNRSYDLRVSEADKEIENMDNEGVID